MSQIPVQMSQAVQASPVLKGFMAAGSKPVAPARSGIKISFKDHFKRFRAQANATGSKKQLKSKSAAAAKNPLRGIQKSATTSTPRTAYKAVKRASELKKKRLMKLSWLEQQRQSYLARQRRDSVQVCSDDVDMDDLTAAFGSTKVEQDTNMDCLTTATASTAVEERPDMDSITAAFSSVGI